MLAAELTLAVFTRISLLKVSFASQEVIICEGEKLNLRCGSNETIIYVEDAFYGRRNMSICKDPVSELDQVHCTAPSSLPTVWATCHGKNSCMLSAKNEDFEVDPCPRLRKYLSVHYHCDIKGADVIGDCPFQFWYPWMNADGPSGTGDYETFYRHKSSLPDWCDKPDAVQIQQANGKPIADLRNVIKSGANYGVSCSNAHQSNNKCGDYRARFCCSSDCAQEIVNKTQGKITSPNYPGKYQPNTDCSWIIKTSFDRYLSFTVTFLELEKRKNCLFDHLKILDLQTQQEMFSGCYLKGNSSISVKGSGNSTQVRFLTDGNHEGAGFSLEWKAVKVPVCKEPTAPLNGGFLPVLQLLWRVGTFVRYYCNQGFNMEGDDVILCEPNKKWSTPRPLCKADCAPSPGEYFQKLPEFCTGPDGTAKYMNVGKCSNNKCRGKKKIISDGEYCCRTADTAVEKVDCGAFFLPVTKIVRCECDICLEDKVIVSGLALGIDGNNRLVNGTIKHSNKVVARTDSLGNFMFSMKTTKRKVTLTFVDDTLKKFLTKVQVVEILPDGQNFVRVIMTRRPPVMRITSNQSSTVVLKSGITGTDDEVPPVLGEFRIAPNSIKDENGDQYDGKVEVYAHSVNNDNPESWKESPGPLVARSANENEDPVPLENYGLFQIQVNGPAKEPLEVENMEVRVNASQVKVEHLPKVRLWYFNNSDAVWEEEGPMQVYYDESAGDDRAVFLIGTINVTVDRIWSLNVLVEEYCYAKVRTYASPEFDHRDQIDGVSVRAVYMGASGRWNGFSSEITLDGNGACIMVPCTGESDDIRVIHVTATTSDTSILWAAASNPFKPKVVGFSKFLADLLRYKRLDHENRRLSKASFNITVAKEYDTSERWYGPIYASSQSERCFLAPPSDYHFRFYRNKKARSLGKSATDNEYTVERVGGNASDPGYWGPEEGQNLACFIKVAVRKRSVLLRATSSAGLHHSLKGQLYGYRQKATMGNDGVSSVCLEFKCAKYFHDGIMDRPYVVVNAPNDNCQSAEVNSLLQHYLNVIEPVTSSKTGDGKFDMFAPTSALGSDFGIYTAKMSTYKDAVKDAMEQCREGSSIKPYAGTMKHDVGIAVTFQC